MFKDGSQVHEESQCMPDKVTIPNSELLHDEMSVVEDECTHDKETHQDLDLISTVQTDQGWIESSIG